MGFVDRLLFVLGRGGVSGSRAYAAAKMGRLTADWISTATSIDADIRSGLVAVRSRARDLSQNNEFARAYLRAVRTNVVGSEGFTLQVKAKEYINGQPVMDTLANSILENAFYDWARPETATVSGKMSLRKAEEVVIESTARDGDMFVRMVRNTKMNKYGFSLQLIEPDWVDEKYNDELKNGNIIRMGVEIDQWRRPVAYYVSKRNNVLDLYGVTMPSGPYIRIPADEMIHLYDPERADQTRAVSWMAPVMLGLHNLGGYVEAAIINARSGANKLGFFHNADGTAAPQYEGDTKDTSGRYISSSEPGTLEDIGDKRFTPYDPKYPTEQFDPFVKSILRGISSGLGVSYASLANDLSDVNYSSIRAGLIEERETWKSLQSWFIETFLNRVYSEWLSMALLMGAVNLPPAKYAKFNAPKWTGRRWAWVDPMKDVDAAKAAVSAGFKSATQVINETGGDIEDIYQELAQEKKMAAALGLELDYGAKPQTPEPASDMVGNKSGKGKQANP